MGKASWGPWPGSAGGGAGSALFSGVLIDSESAGAISTYAANIGSEAVVPTANQVDPVGFPIEAQTITGLRGSVGATGAGSGAITFTVYKNGVATALTCTVAAHAAAYTTASDTSHSATFSANDRIDVRVSSVAPMGQNVAFAASTETAGGGGGGGGSDTPAGPFINGLITGVQWQQLGLDWWSQRTQHAIGVMNETTIQVDEPHRFDYTMWPPILSGTGTPTVDLTRSGTVYLMAGATGFLQDSPNPNTGLISGPQTESFYVARKCSYRAATAITGSQIIPLGLESPSIVNTYIEIGINFGLSATHHFLLMDNGSGTPATFDLGPACALGGALCPLGPPFTMAVRMDQAAGALIVEFQDSEVLRLTASSGNLDKLPTSNLGLYATSNNVGLLQTRIYGGFAMLKGPTT